MYAVIQTGGKQYRVAVGDRLKVETLGAEPGDNIELDKVLMISDNGDVQVGTPTLEGQTVSAEVVDNGRGEKNQDIQDEATSRLSSHSRASSKLYGN